MEVSYWLLSVKEFEVLKLVVFRQLGKSIPVMRYNKQVIKNNFMWQSGFQIIEKTTPVSSKKNLEKNGETLALSKTGYYIYISNPHKSLSHSSYDYFFSSFNRTPL